MGEQVTRGWIVALAPIAAVTLGCVLLSLDRGIELTDESSYIYLLRHPDLVLQFVDHRLWGALGGSVVFYRVLPLLLTTATASWVAAGAARALGVRGRAAVFVQLATLVGALGYFSVIRPTMNYGTTALVFGNLFVGLLLHDLARADRRVGFVEPPLLGAGLALLALGRFSAVPAYVVTLLGYAMLRPGGWRARGLLIGWALLTASMSAIVLEAAGFRLNEMTTLGTSLSGVSHRPGDFVPRDLLLIAAMAIVGAAGAGAVAIGGGLGLPRSLLAAGFAGAVLLAAIVDQRGVIFQPEPGASPFQTNINLYGTTYAFYVVAALFAGMLALDDMRNGWGRNARWWGVLLLLGLACVCPFLGTNTGLLARSGLNAGPLFAAIALMALACSERGLIARATTQGVVTGVAALAAFWVFLNAIWSPYGVNGGWSRQTERLDLPAAVAGLRVSPGTAALARDLHGGLARLGFDPARDRLLVGYARPGLALLAGGDLAGLPFVGDDPKATPLLCAQIADAVRRERPRALYGLNLDYRPALVRCLAGQDIDLIRAARRRVSPLVTITVVPLRLPRR